jgi:hypothetical protein
VTGVGMIYVLAAGAVVPGLLVLFGLLSRSPDVTSQPQPPAPPAPDPVEADRIDVGGWTHVAEEAERWLRTQSSS